MKIKYIKAQNFLSIGEPIEIDFTQYGNIINIKGENRDQGPGASNGSGKCFGLNTPILMYDGTIKNVQDIQVNDMVMGPDSLPRKVLSLGSGKEMMYRITSSNGDVFTANESHILALKCSDKKNNHFMKYKKGNYWCIPIKDYLNSTSMKHLMRGTLSSRIRFKKEKIKIDPYILGVWLGDGTTDNTSLIDMQHYKLIGNKHIPNCYKINSIKVRLAVLAGLIDADGGRIDPTTGYEITTKFPKLAEDIVYLCRSLGFNTRTVFCEKKCQTGNGGWYYRIYIKGNCDLIPVRIGYKKCQKRIINKDHLVNGIKVEPIGEDNYYGFQVDKDSLFLLGDFTVVHNSAVISVIVYSLFGDLIKNLNHKEIINIKTKKKLETEIHFDLDGHSYRIVRKRAPDGLELWEDDIDKSGGGIPSTQEEINKIIKLNYTAFINVVCFGQHNTKQFLACNAVNKRIIAENLLSLDKYNGYCTIAKKKLKDKQDRLKTLASVYDKSIQEVASNERQIKNICKQQVEWKMNQLNSIEWLHSQIKNIKNDIIQTGSDSSSNNYSKLQEVSLEIEKKVRERIQLLETIQLATEKIHKLKEDLQNTMLSSKEIIYAIKRNQKEIEDTTKHTNQLLEQDGGTCPLCYGKINKSNFKNVLDHNKEQVKELHEQINISNDNLKVCQSRQKKFEDNLVKLQEALNNAQSRNLAMNKQIKDLEQKKSVINSVFKGNASSGILLLEQQIQNLSDQIERKQDELDPFGDIIKDAKEELEKSKLSLGQFKEEMTNLEAQVPYYEFWIEAFGDRGIRSFVIDEIRPILNTRINYWLQFLIDNKIQLTLSKELEEKIERNPPDGDPFVYNAMSGGEHQRIDLVIALAFAQVMMFTSGTSPSLICLDEVGTNLDRPGIHAVYNTICELSRERQVLVTTHDPDLTELLSEYDTITCIKENGFTRIKEIKR